MSPADRFHIQAAAHWDRCPKCLAAGGEDADPEDLCQMGQHLRSMWRYAVREEAAARQPEQLWLRRPH